LQAQQYNFVKYGVADGLGQTQTAAILQDSRGQVWLGTYEGGLSLYTGKGFRRFGIRDGLPNAFLRVLEEDAVGHIWIGTEKGLCRYDGRVFTYIDSSQVPHEHITHLAADEAGTLWIGTEKSGLYYYRNGTFAKLKVKGFKPFRISAITIKHPKNILVADRYNLYSMQITGADTLVANLNHNLKQEGVYPNTMHVLPDGRLWAGTTKGLWQLNGKTWRRVPVEGLEKYEVTCIKNGRMGQVWVGTNGGGLYNIQTGNLHYKRFTRAQGLADNNVQVLAYDTSGNLWIGTRAGLVCFKGLSFFHVRQQDGLPGQMVWHVYHDRQGRLWVAHEAGLSIYANEQVTNLGPGQGVPPGLGFGSIVQDGRGRIWISTLGRGLAWYDEAAGRLRYMPYIQPWHNINVGMLQLDNQGRVVYGGNASLVRLQYVKGQYVRQLLAPQPDITNDGINCGLVVNDGTLWLGTEDNGIVAFQDSVQYTLGTEQGLLSTVVNDIQRAPDGALWVATSGGGLQRLAWLPQSPDTFAIQSFTDLEGLSSLNVYALTISGPDSVWAGTDRGLDLLVRVGQGRYRVRHFGASQGYTAIETNHRAVCQDPQGRIWWGTTNGITAYQPGGELYNGQAPGLAITQLKMFYENMDWAPFADTLEGWFAMPQNLTLPFDQNHLTFQFQCFDTRSPQDVQYRHRLVGLEDDWSQFDQQAQATYPKIPHGKYTFEVQAKNRYGAWQTTTRQLSFTITPPFYATTWFYGAVVAFLGLMVVGYVNLRTRYLRNAQLRLRNMVTERTAEIEQQKHEIETQRDHIETQRDELALKSNRLELALTDIRSKNLQITSSITYAKRIQEAMLPLPEVISAAFQEHFIFFRPRDIVSGDFYWFSRREGVALMAVVDCTGHGVPGAIMSMIGSSLLNQIVNENDETDPSAILEQLHKGVRKALKQGARPEDISNRDGMDVAVIALDIAQGTLRFAGACRPLIIVRQGQLLEYKGGRLSIGGLQLEEERVFKVHTVPLLPNDMLYLFTDGYADQFGGTHDRKFMLKRFKELLVQIAPMPVKEQHKRLDACLFEWMGQTDQTDDVLTVGIRYTGPFGPV